MAPKRILIIGDAGSGKSTVACRLGAALNIPVTHLDRLRCEDTFDGVEPEVYRRRHEAVLARECWIIEGIPKAGARDGSALLGSPTARRRLAACDTLIFLDFPPLLTLWRSLRRSRERSVLSAAIPKAADYRFNLFNLKRTLYFRFWMRPRILRELRGLQDGEKLVLIASSDAQLESIVERLST
jgi:adenylate kinase family enzyme